MANLNSSQPEISVVVLCYRAGESIKKFLDKLINFMANNFKSNFELILVGNYHPRDSHDTTPAIVQSYALKYPFIKAVTRPKQGMMGWDMKSGLAAATGRYLAVIDGDNQMPIEDLIRVYNLLKEDHLDLVKTYRVIRADSFYRRLISVGYNIFFKFLFPGLKSWDINSKPKIFSLENYHKLTLDSDGWFIDAEIMIQARRLNFKLAELPTVFRELDSARRSFVRLSAILEFIKNLIVYRLKEFRHKKKL